MGLRSRVGVVEVAVNAKRPAVIRNERGDESRFMLRVKTDRKCVGLGFWTLRYLCRHRYARIGTHVPGCSWHAELGGL